MRLQFQGAARTVTGSMHLLTAGFMKGIMFIHGDPDQPELLGSGLRECGYPHVGKSARGEESLPV